MVDIAYIAFVASFAVLGALFGIAGHFLRANTTLYAEDLGLGEPLNTLTRSDYQWERYVIGAEWDDAGYWASDSVRNLVYYMATGFCVPLVVGLMLWGEREQVVTTVCAGLAAAGLNSPLCP